MRLADACERYFPDAFVFALAPIACLDHAAGPPSLLIYVLDIAFFAQETLQSRYGVAVSAEVYAIPQDFKHQSRPGELVVSRRRRTSLPAMRLATVASAFSEWLVSSPYAAEVTPAQLLTYLAGVPETCNADPRPKKLEWMIRQAKSLAGK